MRKTLDKYKNLPIQLKASVWFLVCSFLQKGISTITTPIFTRILTTAEYGQFNVFNSWLGIVTVIVCLDLYAGVYTQGLIKFEKDKFRFASSLQGLNLVLISAWTLIYYLTKEFWNHIFNLTTVQMIAMLVMIWTTATFRFWSTEKRVTYSYKILVIVTLIVSLAKPIIGILFVLYSEDKVTARILGLVLVELMCYSWMFVAQMIRGHAFFDKKYWIYALKFNIPLVPHYLSQIVLNSSDRLMINAMVGPSEAGIYSLAYSISQIMVLFNQAFLQTIEPWIYQKIKDNRAQDIKKIAYPVLLFIAGLNLLLILFAPEAVKIFAPADYYNAIWVIPPITMSVVFYFSYSFFSTFEFYYEKTKFIMIASVFGAVLNIILNWVFIKGYGYYAAGYTTLICYMAFAVGHYLFMKKICNLYLPKINVFNTTTLALISLSFIVLGFIIMLLYPLTLLRYFIIIICLILIFAYKNKIINLIKKIRNGNF